MERDGPVAGTPMLPILLAVGRAGPHPVLVSAGAGAIVAMLALVAVAAFAESVWSLLRREPPRR